MPGILSAARNLIANGVFRVGVAVAARGYAFAKATRWNRTLQSLSGRKTGPQLWNLQGKKLQDYSRGLRRNVPEAARAVDYLADKVLGPDGFWPTFDTGNAEFDTILKAEWDNWSDSVDSLGEDSWADVLRIAVCEWVTVGEAFAAWSIGDGGRLNVDLFESQQLTSLGTPAQGNYIADGIEYTDTGRAVAYHFSRSLPTGIGSSTSIAPVRIPAAQVVHLMRKERPTDRRGISLFAAIGEDMNHLMESKRAELLLIRALAFLGLWLEQPPGLSGVDSANGLGRAPGDKAEPEKANEQIELDAGMVHFGQEKPHLLDSNRPSGEFQSFVVMLLKSAAARLGIPYTAFSGDTSQANYASMRGEEMHCRPGYRAIQGLVTRKFCAPILRSWIRALVASRRVTLPKGITIDTIARTTRWQVPGWDWVDPANEAEAAQIALNMGDITLPQHWIARGKDPIEQCKAIKYKEALEEQFDIKLPGIGSFQKDPIDPAAKAARPDPRPGEKAVAV